MILQAVVEGPMLYAAFSLFFGCLLLRISIIGYTLIKKCFKGTTRSSFPVSLFIKACAPAHRLFIIKPIYVSLRYLFHVCLIVVPIGFAGHVMLWEESIFQQGYWSIGYGWSNGITLVVLFALLIFFFRRIIIKTLRKSSSIYDYLLLLVTAVPYFTGYILANDTIEDLAEQFGF